MGMARLLKRLATVFFVRIGGAALAVLMNALVVRLFGLSVSGQFFVFLGLVAVLSTVMRVGLDYTIVRFVSISAEDFTPRLFSHSAVLVAGATLVVAALLLAAIATLPESLLASYGLPRDYILLVLASWCHALSFIAAATLQGLGMPNFTTVVRTSLIPIVFMATLASLHVSASLDEAALPFLYAVSSFVVAVSSFLIVWKKTGSLAPPKLSKQERKSVYRSASALYPVALVEMFIAWFTQVYAAGVLPSDEIANLAFATRLSLAAAALLMAINLLLAPHFAKLHADGDEAGFRRIVRTATLASLVLSSAIYLVVLFFAEQILVLLAPDLRGAATVLRIIMFGRFLFACAGPVSQVLAMTGNEKDARNAMLATAVVCAVSSAALTHLYGLIGAAVATALTYGTSTAIMFVMVRMRLGFWTTSFHELRKPARNEAA